MLGPKQILHSPASDRDHIYAENYWESPDLKDAKFLALDKKSDTTQDLCNLGRKLSSMVYVEYALSREKVKDL